MPPSRSTSEQREGSAHGDGVTAGKAAASLTAPTALATGALNDSPATYQLVRCDLTWPDRLQCAPPLTLLSSNCIVNSFCPRCLQGGGAALVVRFGLCEVAGLGLHHLAPNVHYEAGTRTACVFSGHLQVRLCPAPMPRGLACRRPRALRHLPFAAPPVSRPLPALASAFNALPVSCTAAAHLLAWLLPPRSRPRRTWTSWLTATPPRALLRAPPRRRPSWQPAPTRASWRPRRCCTCTSRSGAATCWCFCRSCRCALLSPLGCLWRCGCRQRGGPPAGAGPRC